MARRTNTSIHGTAFVEAIALIPALGTILAAVLALHGMYSAKLEAKARATRLAWLQADSGRCPDTPCSSSACDVAVDELTRDGLDEIASVERNGFSLESFVGGLGGFLFGGITRGRGIVEAELPVSLGHRQTEQTAVTALPCNTTARSTETGLSVLEHACATDLGRTEYARGVCE